MMSRRYFILLIAVMSVVAMPMSAVEYNLSRAKFRNVNTMVDRKQQVDHSFQNSYNVGMDATWQVGQTKPYYVGPSARLFQSSQVVARSVGNPSDYRSASVWRSQGSIDFHLVQSHGLPKTMGFANISRQNMLRQSDMLLAAADQPTKRDVGHPDEKPIGELEPIGDCPIGLLALMLLSFVYYYRRKRIMS